MAEDFAETHNVAAEHRDRLIALIGTWYVEAGKYGVLPIDGSGLARMIAEKPLVAPPRDQLRYYRPDTQSVPFFAGAAGAQPAAQHHRRGRDPRRRRRGRAARARAPPPAATRFFIKDGKLRLRPQLRRPRPATASNRESTGARPGKHELRFEFEPTGQPDMPHGKGAPGRLQLYVDGALVGDAEAPITTPFVFNPGALTCGANPGSPVTPGLPEPVPVHRHHPHVTVDVSGELIDDPEAELRMHMARQ